MKTFRTLGTFSFKLNAVHLIQDDAGTYKYIVYVVLFSEISGTYKFHTLEEAEDKFKERVTTILNKKL